MNDAFDLITTLARDHRLSDMLCHISEIGREVDVVTIDSQIDPLVLKARAAGHDHHFASITDRRAALKALVAAGALDEVKSQAGDVIGWRMTELAINNHCAAIGSGFVDEKDAPPWLLERMRGAT